MRRRVLIHWRGSRKRPPGERNYSKEIASSATDKMAEGSPRKIRRIFCCRKFSPRAMAPFSGNSRMEIRTEACRRSADCQNSSGGNWCSTCARCTRCRVGCPRTLRNNYTIGSRWRSAHHAQGTTIHMLNAPQAIDRSFGGAPAARLATHPKNRKTSNAHKA